MVDVLSKLQEVGDPWVAPPPRHYGQQNAQHHPGTAPADHNDGSGPSKQNDENGHGTSRRGGKGSRGKISNNLGSNRSHSASSSRFIPAPRPPKHTRRTREHLASVRNLNQIKLGDRLAEFKCHPTIYPEPLHRPFHGRACKCMPFSAINPVVPEEKVEM